MFQALAATLVVVLALTCVIPPVVLARRLRRYCRAAAGRGVPPGAGDDDAPRVMVVLPVKGIPAEMPDLEANLTPVLEQDYPAYRVVFAVGSEDDPARGVLDRLCERYPHASLVVAGPNHRCSQKVGNQLRALRELRGEEEVLVFLDSDARPHRSLLRELIAPLRDQRVGASTGFRWYSPGSSAGAAPAAAGGKRLGSWLRAAWNAGGLPFMIEPAYSYAWGGAMAIRREVFEGCRVAEYWRTALSDDLGLTSVVKGAGYRVALVPGALVPSPERLSLPQVIEWTTRQTVICRVYHPRMWRDLFVGEAITAATLLLALASLVYGVSRGHAALALEGAVVIAAVLAGRAVYQAMVLGAVREIAPVLVSRGAWLRLVALTPLVHPLFLYNNLRSFLSRRIAWRGIRYELRGPQEIVVLPERG